MAVLRITASVMDDIASDVMGAAPEVEFGRVLSSSGEDALASAAVARALADGTTELTQRSSLAGAALVRAGKFPRDAAAEFAAADLRISKAL
jgi:hypothetical protein